MRVFHLLLAMLLASGMPLAAQQAIARADSRPQLRLRPADVIVEQTPEGGYYLWVRRLPGMESILLTESTEASDNQPTTYAYRSPVPHPSYATERRILDGEVLNLSDGTWSLVDSTAEPHATLGEAFRIFVPWVVRYGYEWTRNGEVQVLDGTYLSIRSFSERGADYRGSFQDNPFVLRVTQRAVQLPEPSPEPTPEAPTEPPYMPATVDSFTGIAQSNDGLTRSSPGEADLPEQIRDIINSISAESLDLVLVVDTTQSMENDLPHVQQRLTEILADASARFASLRVGLVYYRDYFEEYLNEVHDFQSDLSRVQASLDRIRVAGGRDLPEAVYEALYAAVIRPSWTAQARRIVLIGDAPPHPQPRGAVTASMVAEAARERSISIDTIILPP